ncbi:MAG: biotin--[acetyl-CoA-carboxylase] ligase [Alphaproteobacteria bacterium]
MTNRLPSELKLPPAYRLVAYETLPSTMDEARNLALCGAEEGTIIWAKAQSAGRGRHGRTWQSNLGNLYLSIILRPACRLIFAAEIGFVASLALKTALEKFLPPEVSLILKWPNDLLGDNRKVAGIILEALSSSEIVDGLILGVGVNVTHYPPDDDVRFPATSLVQLSSGAKSDVLSVLEAFATCLHTYLYRWRSEGFSKILEAWQATTYPLGTPISIGLSATRIKGKYKGLGPRGELLLELPDGHQQSVNAGDVYFHISAQEK